ncbi:MAG TPA: DUF4054 domain-containing protein [Candidatus Limnocylindrales bacterium]|nr:DUF4054 domain-containing protein [Candidatus Limnocylindrales bacterium]
MEPSLNLFFDDLCSGFGWDWGALTVGVVCGTNPPYGVADFFAVFPKFFGVATAIQAATTTGSAVVQGTGTTWLSAGFAAGQLANSPAFPAGTLITSVDSDTQITLSQPATATGNATISVFAAPLVPMAVLTMYITLASGSLVQARWLDTWLYAMALYCAHFCTLYLQSDGSTCTAPGAVAASGLARGIATSKGVGGVSFGFQPVQGLEQWAAWTLTSYGTQLASFAKTVGAGPVWVP